MPEHVIREGMSRKEGEGKERGWRGREGEAGREEMGERRRKVGGVGKARGWQWRKWGRGNKIIENVFFSFARWGPFAYMLALLHH